MAKAMFTSVKVWGVRLVLVGLGVAAGLFVLAPMQAQQQPGYMSAAFLSLPTGVVQVSSDSNTALLPVRLLETADTRRMGLNGVGARALDTMLVLYSQPRDVTRTSYNTDGIRVPLELAVIDSDGRVVSIKKVAPGTKSLSVAERHRYVLAAKDGVFGYYGVAVNTVVDTGNIRKTTFAAQ